MIRSAKRQELRPHVRNERPSTEDVVVIRGGPDTLAKLTAHARRTHRAFCLDGLPLWDLSVFLALDDIGPASLEGLLKRRMSTYRIVCTPASADLREAGFALLPTFHRPHYTLALTSDAEAEVSRLLDALGSARDNPYHGGRGHRER